MADELNGHVTLKIGALTKLGLFFPVVFIPVFDQTLAEQLSTASSSPCYHHSLRCTAQPRVSILLDSGRLFMHLSINFVFYCLVLLLISLFLKLLHVRVDVMYHGRYFI